MRQEILSPKPKPQDNMSTPCGPRTDPVIDDEDIPEEPAPVYGAHGPPPMYRLEASSSDRDQAPLSEPSRVNMIRQTNINIEDEFMRFQPTPRAEERQPNGMVQWLVHGVIRQYPLVAIMALFSQSEQGDGTHDTPLLLCSSNPGSHGAVGKLGFVQRRTW
jgi:hypothetical protein